MSDMVIAESATVYATVRYIVPFNEIHVEVAPAFAEELLAALVVADLPGMLGERDTPSHIIRLKRGVFNFIRAAQFDYRAPNPTLKFLIKDQPK